jgi:vitamin B12 transporter
MDAQPNAILFFDIPDDAAQKAQNTYYSDAWNNQATTKRHNEIRYGGLRLNSQFDDLAPIGIPDAFGDYLGGPIRLSASLLCRLRFMQELRSPLEVKSWGLK